LKKIYSGCYIFHSETWNHYCERQRKFRQEFATDQAAINKAILSNIQIVGPPIGLTTFAGGRQLVNLAGGHVESKQQQNKVQKIVVDLSKPPPFVGHSTGNDFPVTLFFINIYIFQFMRIAGKSDPINSNRDKRERDYDETGIDFRCNF
jgi:hypothetical protein